MDLVKYLKKNIPPVIQEINIILIYSVSSIQPATTIGIAKSYSLNNGFDE